MNRLRFAFAVGATLFVAAPSVQAQLRGTNTASVGAVPNGMCRIWIDDVPAERQPAPTDCNTARARVPRNGRVIYGSQTQGPVYSDPRLDPRSGQYDPRLDPRNGQYGGQAYPGERGRGNRDWKTEKEREKLALKQQKEREKWARKQQKENEKEWKKSHQGSYKHDDQDDDNDGQHGRRGHDGEQGNHGKKG
jgi:hypothetical protein